MQTTMMLEKFDDLYTPVEAVTPLLGYLPEVMDHEITAWECCDSGSSNITNVLKEHGYKVLSTDIKTGFDFLNETMSEDVLATIDFIITNPPYSLKDEFIRKCYEYQKPFALLLPLTALEGIERGKMFNEYGISVVVLDKRIDFTGKKSCWFNTSWFVWNLPEGFSGQVYFEHVEKQ